ncbi:MAG: hypothetical protein ACREQA_21250 [Candidatus Binatia bacterium]
MMRFPTFHLAPPSPGEIRRVLWRGPAAIVSYNLEPDDRHPVNAWLYLCANREYALDKLPPPMRRNVRRGLKELRIEPITCDQVLDYGFQAFCDSIRRIGLREETPEQFRRYFTWRAGCPGHVFLGAWKDEKLAGFLSIPKVDDWAEIEGPFSLDALLNLRVNDTLLFYALSRYLSEGLCRVVSYGLSSIQGVSNKAGLHVFKTKVGFEARPVHRAFVLHPLIRPFANRLTLWSVNAMLRFRPRDRRLKKVGGVLACVLGDGRILEMEEENISDE